MPSLWPRTFCVYHAHTHRRAFHHSSQVEYYFLAPDGTGFKCAQASPAYFYISVAAGHESEVDTSLRRKFPDQVHDIKFVDKEDLTLVNHLSGKKKLYLKLLFRSTRELMEVGRTTSPLARLRSGLVMC